MLSTECYLGRHDYCTAPGNCECLCHASVEELIEELNSEQK